LAELEKERDEASMNRRDAIRWDGVERPRKDKKGKQHQKTNEKQKEKRTTPKKRKEEKKQTRNQN
jgi:hypothetical protein